MKINNYIDFSAEILFQIDSILELTKDNCLEKELSAKYYELTDINQKKLSEERNHYINMISLAQEKFEMIKNYILQ